VVWFPIDLDAPMLRRGDGRLIGIESIEDRAEAEFSSLVALPLTSSVRLHRYGAARR
jgi:hypothetical protein